jgi:hypothetical protein
MSDKIINFKDHEYMKQCLLVRYEQNGGRTEQLFYKCWIPEARAKMGKYVKVQGVDGKYNDWLIFKVEGEKVPRSKLK